MVMNPASGALRPISAEELLSQIPELSRFDLEIDVISTEIPIDSSEVGIRNWREMAKMIGDLRLSVWGIVLLHGTDTMAYTASALSFMLENIDLPVILTGSQLPMGQIRTDGKENLISAIEIASLEANGRPLIQEVCVYFQSKLFRGNRTHKFSTEHFDAFISPNFDPLAEVGIRVNMNENLLLRPRGVFQLHSEMAADVALLTLFPGISEGIVEAVTGSKKMRGLILETFGSGNSLREAWFLNLVAGVIKRGIPVLNITQCNKGRVDQRIYETGRVLESIGVIGGSDLTREAAITKMMFVLENYEGKEVIKKKLSQAICGEMS
jgi:L-asparaginase